MGSAISNTLASVQCAPIYIHMVILLHVNQIFLKFVVRPTFEYHCCPTSTLVPLNHNMNTPLCIIWVVSCTGFIHSPVKNIYTTITASNYLVRTDQEYIKLTIPCNPNPRIFVSIYLLCVCQVIKIWWHIHTHFLIAIFVRLQTDIFASHHRVGHQYDGAISPYLLIFGKYANWDGHNNTI